MIYVCQHYNDFYAKKIFNIEIMIRNTFRMLFFVMFSFLETSLHASHAWKNESWKITKCLKVRMYL